VADLISEAMARQTLRRDSSRMNALAIALVLGSAVMHASWNLLAKRSSDALAFLFAMNLVSMVVFAPVTAWMLARHGLAAEGLPFLLASAVFESIYLLALAAAYRHGALTVAYPVARGTGVLLVPLLAVPLLGEELSTVAVAGIGAILAGLLTINLPSFRAWRATDNPEGLRGLSFAVLTGLSICGYSLVDKAGVDRVHPLVYLYAVFGMMTIFIAPYVLTRRRAPLAYALRTELRAVVAGAVLNPGTYFIILAAMSLSGSKVGYIVPLRETSIVFATLLGALVLRERVGRLRVAGSIVVVGGVLAIALGG
jgi:drug/metabolite transporter (DMT)-like permease